MSDTNTQAYVFAPPEPVTVPVSDGRFFPVRRIFCIGRNFADHVREMGGDPKADPPVFFSKPADAVLGNGSTVAYPKATENLHFEGELVAALGGDGENLSTPQAAEALIFGYACGCDLTRRDLQNAAKRGGTPWDTAKGFDESAPMGTIVPAAELPDGALESARLTVTVNEKVLQDAALSSMIWSIGEIIMTLSTLYKLRAGDLVFTGTPEGVGPLVPGDVIAVRIDAIPTLEFSVGP